MTHTLQTRVTHKYVGTYQHLDDWAEIGSFEIVAKSDLIEAYDFTDHSSQVFFVEVNSPFPDDDLDPSIHERKIKQALNDHFTQWGCSHEYDCCGCRSYSGTAEHVGGSIWKVTQTSTRNY